MECAMGMPPEPPPTPSFAAQAPPARAVPTAACCDASLLASEPSLAEPAPPSAATWSSYLGAAAAPQPAEEAAGVRPSRTRVRALPADYATHDDSFAVEDESDGEATPAHHPGASLKKYRGVWLDKKRNKFKTRIWVSGRTLFLGSHTSEDEAARAYDQVAISRGGLDAFTNFPASDYDCERLMATPLPTLVAELRGQASRCRVEAQTSRHRGVCRHKQTGKWSARIQERGTKYFLGLFDTEAEAAAAFDEEAAHRRFTLEVDVPRTPRTPRAPRAPRRRSPVSGGSGGSSGAAWCSSPGASDVGDVMHAPKKPRTHAHSAAWSGGAAAAGSAGLDVVSLAAHTLLLMCVDVA